MYRVLLLLTCVLCIQPTYAQYLDALLTGMSWSLKETVVRPDNLVDINLRMVVNVSSESQHVTGTGLWNVVVYGSKNIKGRGKRFDPRRNLLTESQQTIPTLPGRSMIFDDISIVFDLNGLGCSEFKYMCVEFKQGYAPDPDFFFASMDFEETLILCANVDCEEDTGPKDVMVIGLSWILDAFVRQGTLSDVIITSSIHMSPNQGGAEGTDLWLMGLFLNSQKDGKGESLPQRYEQILNRTQASKNILPGQKLNITGTASIDLTGVGCGKFKFLCIEFGKGIDPKPNDFGFSIGTGDSTIISCRQLSCSGGTSNPDEGDTGLGHHDAVDGSDGRGGKIFRVDDMTWEMSARSVSIGKPSDLLINVIISVADDSDFISGRNLWRVGIYGSESPDNSSSLRSNYMRQILPGSKRAQFFLPGLDTVMIVRVMYDLNHVGCGSFQYLCLEFTKSELADPDFEFVSDSGDTRRSCQRAQCTRRNHPVTTQAPALSNGLKNFYLTSMDWTMRAHLSSTHLSNFLLDMDIVASSKSDTIDGTSLWRVGLFGSRNADGSGERLSISEQILPERYRSVTYQTNVPLKLVNIRGSEDLRGMYCTDVRFLCVELGKHPDATPDFNFHAEGHAETIASCQEIPCDEPNEETNTGSNNQGSRRGDHGDGSENNQTPGDNEDQSVVGSSGTHNQLGGGGAPHIGAPLYTEGVLSACTVNGVIIDASQSTAVSPCLTCKCIGSGVVICSELSCVRPLTCAQPVFIAGKCCATCLGEEPQPRNNLPCIFDGQIVLNNQEFWASGCTQCTCQDGSITCIATCALAAASAETTVALSTVTPSRSIVITNIEISKPAPVYQKDTNVFTIDVTVETDTFRSTDISGNRLWRLNVWGSIKQTGSGPKLSYTKDALKPSQLSQDFRVNEPFVFTEVPILLDMSRKTCKQLKYVCTMLKKNPENMSEFTFNTSPIKANIACKRLTCRK